MNYRRLRMAVLATAVAGAILSVVWVERRTRPAPLSARPAAAPGVNRADFPDRVPPAVPPATAQVDSPGPVPPAPSFAESVPAGRWWATTPPELQNLYLAAERASLPGRYAALWENLGLTTEQTEKLADLIMQRNEQLLDIGAVVRPPGLGEREPAVQRLRTRADQAFRGAVTALLGEAAYQEVAQYERALPVWQLVNSFAGAVALEGQPLTGEQAVQLTNTVANASPPFRAGGEADPNLVEWPVVLAESATILTTPQQVSFVNAVPRYPVALGPGQAQSSPFSP